MRRKINFAIGLALLSGISVPVMASDLPNWTATLDTNPLTQKQACLLESVTQTINDGRTTTPMHMVFDGKSLLVVTRSKIDLSYPDVGMHVDSKAGMTVDRLHKDTSVIFDKDPDLIRDQFIRGRTAFVALGFWPTWPKSNTTITQFSLMGFTVAYHEFEDCQKTHANLAQKQ